MLVLESISTRIVIMSLGVIIVVNVVVNFYTIELVLLTLVEFSVQRYSGSRVS